MKSQKIIISSIVCLVLIINSIANSRSVVAQSVAQSCGLDLIVLLDISPSMVQRVEKGDKHNEIARYLNTYLRAVHNQTGHNIQASLITFAYTGSQDPNYKVVIPPRLIHEWDIRALENITFHTETETETSIGTDFIAPLAKAKELFHSHGSLSQPGCSPVILLMTDADFLSHPRTYFESNYILSVRDTVLDIRQAGISLHLVAFEAKDEHIDIWENTVGIPVNNIHRINNMSQQLSAGFYDTIFENLLPLNIRNTLPRQRVQGAFQHRHAIESFRNDATVIFVLDEGLQVQALDAAWELTDRSGETDAIYTFKLVAEPEANFSEFLLSGIGVYTVLESSTPINIFTSSGVIPNDDSSINVQVRLYTDSPNVFRGATAADGTILTRFETVAHVINTQSQLPMLFNPSTGIYDLRLESSQMPSDLSTFPLKIQITQVEPRASDIQIAPITLDIHKLSNCGLRTPPIAIAPVEPEVNKPFAISVDLSPLYDDCSVTGGSLNISKNDAQTNVERSVLRIPLDEAANDLIHHYINNHTITEPGEYIASVNYRVLQRGNDIPPLNNSRHFTVLPAPAPPPVEIVLNHFSEQVVEGSPVTFRFTVRNSDDFALTEQAILQIFEQGQDRSASPIYRTYIFNLPHSANHIEIPQGEASFFAPGIYEAQIVTENNTASTVASFVVVPAPTIPSLLQKSAPFIGGSILGILLVLGIIGTTSVYYQKLEPEAVNILKHQRKIKNLSRKLKNTEAAYAKLEQDKNAVSTELTNAEDTNGNLEQKIDVLEREKRKLEAELEKEQGNLATFRQLEQEIKEKINKTERSEDDDKYLDQLFNRVFNHLAKANRNSAIRRGMDILGLFLIANNVDRVKEIAPLSQTSRLFVLQVLAQTLVKSDKWRDEETVLQEIYNILSRGGNVELLAAVVDATDAPLISNVCRELTRLTDQTKPNTPNDLTKVATAVSRNEFGDTGKLLGKVYNTMKSCMETNSIAPLLKMDIDDVALKNKLPALSDLIEQIPQKDPSETGEVESANLLDIYQWAKKQVENGNHIPELFWLVEQTLEWQIKTAALID